MTASDILILITKRNEIIARWRIECKEIQSCKNCTKERLKQISLRDDRIVMAQRIFKEDLESGRTVVRRPTSIIETSEMEINMVKNGYGFTACSKDHIKIVEKITDLVGDIDRIDGIIKKVSK